MKVLLLSDNHGRNGGMQTAVENEMPDHILHTGDIEGSERFLYSLTACPIDIVSGNCDYFTSFPKVNVVEIAGHRILITHGHLYMVNVGFQYLAKVAADNDCDIAVFGHIHVPVCQEVDGVLMINPGSITLPRQENHRPSYAVMDLADDGRVSVHHVYL